MPVAWPLEGASGAQGGRQRPCWSRCHRLTPFLWKVHSILSVPWKVMLVADMDLGQVLPICVCRQVDCGGSQGSGRPMTQGRLHARDSHAPGWGPPWPPP